MRLDGPRRVLAFSFVVAVSFPVAAQTAGAAGDPFLGDQWALARIGAPAAWTHSRGAGITVAVIDSGVDATHEDLKGRIRTAVTCLGTTGDPDQCTPGSAADDDGHGTHVAGILGATQGNGLGVAGVSPEATLLDVKALRRVCVPPQVPGTDLHGSGSCHAEGAVIDVRAAMRWASSHGANVINLSLAEDAVTRSTTGSSIAPEVKEAWAAGIVVVVASGNDLDVLMGSGYGDLPVLVVTATGPNDARARYANSVGEVRWGVAAPGGSSDGPCPTADILSTYRDVVDGPGYACMSGTSMAAPHVSGAIALLLAKGWTASSAVDRLVSTAQDIGAPGRDKVFGYGMINASLAASGSSPPKPRATSTSASQAAAGAGSQPSSPEAVPAAAPTAAPTPVVAPSPLTTPAQVRAEDVGERGQDLWLLPWVATMLLAATSVVFLVLRTRRRST